MKETLAVKEARLKHLSIAEEVFASLPDVGGNSEREPLAETRKPTWSEKRSPKPDGTPTMPDMIFEALQDGQIHGRKGLEPKDIALYIAGRWWPDVTINSVGPIAWRMYKQGRLTKRGSKYFLPKNDEGRRVNVRAFVI